MKSLTASLMTKPFKRVNPKNCEWLICPQIRISEFAVTIDENMEFLATANNTLIHTRKFAEMQQMLSGFLQCLHRLNTRNMEKPNLADVKHETKTILKDNDDIDSFFDSMVNSTTWCCVFDMNPSFCCENTYDKCR